MHVDDFATHLRELKERSGRSYGMLAKRLHVSTSTLHRYCNGAAVPADYAPVERFARLCGAKPEELVELHRRWLLADAERRREPARAPKNPVVAAEPERVPQPDPEPEPEPAPERVPQTDPEPAPERVPQTDPEPEPEPAPERVPEPVPELGPEPAPVEARAHLPAARGSRPPRTPRPRRPRRPQWTVALLAALAVLAIAVPVALTTARDRSGGAVSATSPGTGSASHGIVTAPTTTARTTIESGGTGSPSSRASRSPQPSGQSSGQSGQSGSPTASGEAASVGDTADAPFTVSVMSDNWDSQCDQWFLTQQAPSGVPTPPGIEDTDRWAGALGAVPAAHLRLQLTAQGRSGKAVVLHAMYVHVVSSRPATKGYGYTTGSGCGGGLTPASFAVDLDSTSPVARAVPGYEGNNPTPLVDFPFRTSASDPQVLDVDAHTAGQDVSWVLYLSWSCGDQQGTQRIDDNGRPFRTVGLAGDPTYSYDGRRWAAVAPPT